MSRGSKYFAPAKINLFLHVTDKLDNGYHELESLVSFADIGDELIVYPADIFSFHVSGPFAGDLDGGDNIVVKAAEGLAALLGHELKIGIELQKNLPVAAGLGGGSSDAAAMIRALLETWEYNVSDISGFDEFLMGLGADVPVCFLRQPAFVAGIGEKLQAVKDGLPSIPLLLVNPGISCLTQEVFRRLSPPYSSSVTVPDALEEEALIDFLVHDTRNDLTDAAMQTVPQIAAVLEVIEGQYNCALARLCGSGATCFALFRDTVSAEKAFQAIQDEYPRWWVRQTSLLS